MTKPLDSAKGNIRSIAFYDAVGSFIDNYKTLANTFPKIEKNKFFIVLVVTLYLKDKITAEVIKNRSVYSEISSATLDSLITSRRQIPGLDLSVWQKLSQIHFDYNKIKATPVTIFDYNKTASRKKIKQTGGLYNLQDLIEIFTSPNQIRGNPEISRKLALAKNYKYSNKPLLVQGGNIIPSRDFLLFGLNAIQKNSKSVTLNKINASAIKIGKSYGYKPSETCPVGVIELSDNTLFRDTFFHLDCYLTYLGERRRKKVFLLAQVESIIDQDGNNNLDTVNYLNSSLNQIGLTLEAFFRYSVEIIRIPVIADYKTSSFCITWGFNNILVEQNTKTGLITTYLPIIEENGLEYLKKLRRNTISILKNHKIKPASFKIDLTQNISDERTGLHCAAKVLQRS